MKYVPYFIVVIVIYMMIGHFVSAKYTIPKEAIRVRVIAGSNDKYDQEVKMNVKDIVTSDMYNLMSNVDSIESARESITNNIPTLSKDIDKYLKGINYYTHYDINFGYNYFPKKIYKGVEYKEGMYESLVVTLGNGEGNNWWCVLFPPICMIEAEESTDVEYTTMVKEIINKYF